MFSTVPAEFIRFFSLLVGEEIYILIVRFVLLAVVWLIGYRFNKSKGSPILWAVIWAWGILSLIYCLFFIACAFLINRLAFFVAGFLAFWALIAYVSLMVFTVTATFPKQKSSVSNEDPGTT